MKPPGRVEERRFPWQGGTHLWRPNRREQLTVMFGAGAGEAGATRSDEGTTQMAVPISDGCSVVISVISAADQPTHFRKRVTYINTYYSCAVAFAVP